MKKLIATTILLSATALSSATEVTVTGYGASYEDSLQNAKIQALEKVTGTWMNSEHSYDNGKFDESIVQYNGGVIKSYEVISKTDNSVTIKADVEKNKTNVVSGSSVNISETMRNELVRSAENNSQLEKAIQTLNDKNKAFSAKVTKVNYTNFGDQTQVTMIVNLGWNPKWISDVESLSKLIDQKTSPTSNIRQAISAGAASGAISAFGPIGAIVSSILYSPVAGPEPQKSNERAICFGTTRRRTPSDCYIVNSPLTEFQYSSIRFEIEGMSNKVKVLSSNGNIDNNTLYDNLYPGQQKRDIIGLKNSYSNPTVAIFKEESQNMTIQFLAPTSKLAQVDKFNFVFR